MNLSPYGFTVRTSQIGLGWDGSSSFVFRVPLVTAFDKWTILTPEALLHSSVTVIIRWVVGGDYYIMLITVMLALHFVYPRNCYAAVLLYCYTAVLLYYLHCLPLNPFSFPSRPFAAGGSHCRSLELIRPEPPPPFHFLPSFGSPKPPSSVPSSQLAAGFTTPPSILVILPLHIQFNSFSPTSGSLSLVAYLLITAQFRRSLPISITTRPFCAFTVCVRGRTVAYAYACA